MPLDVFEKADERLSFVSDPSDFGPKVPRIVLTSAAASGAERLTRVARSDDLHEATPRLAVEGTKVTPDRRLIQGRVFHPCHESGRSVAFPLNVTNSSQLFCKYDFKCDAQHSGTGAQVEVMEGGR